MDNFTAELVALLPRIRHYTRRMSRGNTDLAESLYSDTLLAALEYRKNFDPKRSQMITWLVLIAKSKVMAHVRYVNTRKRRGTTVDINGLVAEELITRPTQYEERLAAELRAAAASLKGQQKLVITMLLEGYNQAEISRETRRSRAGVSQIGTRAIRNLQKRMGT